MPLYGLSLLLADLAAKLVPANNIPFANHSLRKISQTQQQLLDG